MSILTAEDLYKNTDMSEIRTMTADIYVHLTSRIKDSNSAGLNKLKYELPEFFAVKSTSAADVQLFVCSSLIEKLKRGNLKPGLVRTDKALFITVEWPSMLDAHERQRRKQIIIEHARAE